MAKPEKHQTPQTPTSAKPAVLTKDQKKAAEVAAMHRAFAENPTKFLRSAGFYDTRLALKKPEMTWVEYCDIKIGAYRDWWTWRKTNRNSGGGVGAPHAITDPAKLAKAKLRMEKEAAKLKRLQESIRLSEEAVK